MLGFTNLFCTPTPFQHPAFQILTESQVIEHRYRCTIAMPSLYWLHEMSCVPDWKKSKASLIQILEEKGNIPSDLKKNIGARANRAFAIASLLDQQIVNFLANKSCAFFFFIFKKIKISKIYVHFEIFQKYPPVAPIGRQALSVNFFFKFAMRSLEKKVLSPPQRATGACRPAHGRPPLGPAHGRSGGLVAPPHGRPGYHPL